MLPDLAEIKRRRAMLGMTQSQLARQAGVSQSLIAKLESGKTDGSYSNVKKIFDAFEAMQLHGALTAKDVLNPHLKTVQSSESVSKAVKLMRELNYSQLPVFDSDNAVGSVSEKTILNAISSGESPESVSKRKIEDVMDEAFPTVGENTPVSTVSSLLETSFAVLVKRKKKIVGIISKADLLKVVGKRLHQAL